MHPNCWDVCSCVASTHTIWNMAGEWFELVGRGRLCLLLAEAEALAVRLLVHKDWGYSC